MLTRAVTRVTKSVRMVVNVRTDARDPNTYRRRQCPIRLVNVDDSEHNEPLLKLSVRTTPGTSGRHRQKGLKALSDDETAKQAASSRAVVLERLHRRVQGGTVVNYVLRVNVDAVPAPTTWWRRWRARRRASRPSQTRIEFREWVGLPWRDRPDEARLADVASELGRAITHHPAWNHSLLENQRVQFEPAREVADIACSAYQLYLLRRSVGKSPGGSISSEVAAAQAAFEARLESWQVAWDSLVDRAAELYNYEIHLDRLAPILAATDAAARLETDPVLSAESAAINAAALNELVTNEMRALSAGVDGIRDSLTASAPLDLKPLDPEPLEESP
ncbi:MAG: hypothetical protein ABI382_01755 [Nakamurella sp.]